MRVFVFATLSIFAATQAAAHIRLDFPDARDDDDARKAGPCGKGADEGRSDVISTFEPGATITVRWEETINHEGFFRVAFDEDGDDAGDFDDDDNEIGRLDDPNNDSGKEWTLDVTLPDVECDNCTLQLIQDMTGGTYFQCADIVLKEGAGNDIDDGATGGCSANGRTTPAMLLALSALLARRRVRRAM